MPTIDNWRSTLMRAAINCPHGIVDSEVLLHRTGKQSDGNALAQLADRLAEAVKPLLDERDRLAAEVEALRAEVAKLTEPDMFWDASDPERFAYSVQEISYEYGPGDEVRVDQAHRLPSITIKISDDESGDFEQIDAARGIKEGGAV